MSRNGAGTYSLYAGVNPVVTGTTITSSWANNTLSDIATALTASIANDGQTPILANLPMSTYRHTGVGNAVNRTDYAATGQVQDGAFLWGGTAGGTADALTISVTPVITAYAAGQVFEFIVGASPNATTTPTLNVCGVGAKTFVRKGGSACAIGDLQAGNRVRALYDGTNFRLDSPAARIATGKVLTVSNTMTLAGTDGTTMTFPSTSASIARTDAGQTLTGDQTISAGNVNFDNNQVIAWKDSAGTQRNILRLDSSNDVHLINNAGGSIDFDIGGTTLFQALSDGSGVKVTSGKALKFDGSSSGTVTVKTAAAAGSWSLTLPTSAGSSGQFLKTDGSGTTSWGTLTGITLIATLTPTAAANADALSAFTSSYDNYLILLEGIIPAADDTLLIRFGNSGTADSGSNYFSGTIAGGSNYSTSATSITMGGAVTSAGKGLNGFIVIQNANDATNIKSFSLQTACQTAATPAYINRSGLGVYSAANAVSGVRFLWNGGSNFSASGSIKIYGYANS